MPMEADDRDRGLTRGAETLIERVIFASRWVQAPLYAGLIVAGVLYAIKFVEHLWHMTWDLASLTETQVMLGVLSLIDITMVANLLTVVVIGGYDTFVSKLNLERHEDKPDWLDHINAGTLKIKLAGSLVGVSGIHLLQTFVNMESVLAAGGSPIVLWQVVIHVVFLFSSILLAWTERLLHAR